MASDAPSETLVVRRRRPLGWRIAKWVAIVLAVLVAAAAAFLLWLNTEAGHRFVVDRINAAETTSGLKIHVERIDGSIYGRLTLRNVQFGDTQGTFATSTSPRRACGACPRCAPAIRTRRCFPTSTSTSAICASAGC